MAKRVAKKRTAARKKKLVEERRRPAPRARASSADPLSRYKAKRDFKRTQEPSGEPGGMRRRVSKAGRLSYLIQKHDASRLHYDFRLEWNGTLMSWAIPKGPSENPDDKRLAVHVEDHPVDYGGFEGTIPAGEYGGGTVMLWDRGTWEPQQDASGGVDVDAALRKGKLAFILHGERLKGKWALVRLRARGPKDQDNWLLIKEIDDFVKRSGNLVTERETVSVASGRSMDEIAHGQRVWHSNRKGRTTDRAAAADEPEILAGPAPAQGKAGARQAGRSSAQKKRQ